MSEVGEKGPVKRVSYVIPLMTLSSCEIYSYSIRKIEHIEINNAFHCKGGQNDPTLLIHNIFFSKSGLKDILS